MSNIHADNRRTYDLDELLSMWPITDYNGFTRAIAYAINGYVNELDETLEIEKKDLPSVRVDLRAEVAVMRNRLARLGVLLERMAGETDEICF